MDPFSMLLFAGGTALSLWGANEEKERQQKLAEDTMKIEGERAKLTKETNSLQAARATRDAIRKAQVSRGLALSFGANSGGGLDSSGVFGGLAQIAGQQALTTNAIGQDLGLANQTTDLNLRMSRLAGESMIEGANNQFIQNLGSVISGNSRQLGNLGQQMGTWFST